MLRSWRVKRQLRRVAREEGERLDGVIRGHLAKLDATTARIRKTTWPRLTPECPVCGNEMVRRKAGRGSNAGNFFWGCSRYPGCRGTRDYHDPLELQL